MDRHTRFMFYKYRFVSMGLRTIEGGKEEKYLKGLLSMSGQASEKKKRYDPVEPIVA